MQSVINWLGILRRVGRKAGPYLVLEILLPGGTLLALLLFLYRRWKGDAGGDVRRAIVATIRKLSCVLEPGLHPAPIRLVIPVSKSQPILVRSRS
jgi:hypothetical protein